MHYKELFGEVYSGCEPYPFQVELATGKELPEILECPTGLGKTDAVVGGWIYRRFFCGDQTIRSETPNTLCFVLPMRTLTLQTSKVAERWCETAQNLANKSHDPEMLQKLKVTRLMGGEDCTSWDTEPGVPKILVGTQDMILSRALNRGYAMSRYRWPVEFGQLNNDVLTVLDETQLIGVGVSTAAQLEGFRRKLKTFGLTHTIFMSATLDDRMIETVDHPRPEGDFTRLELSEEDRKKGLVKKLVTASKPIEQADLDFSGNSYAKDLAAMVLSCHKPETTTLVISNQVDRSCKIYNELEKLVQKQGDNSPKLLLIHSRFRPKERNELEAQILDSEKNGTGNPPSQIIVATQAVEAGVDISAATLITELAPWPSLVQRFGRCNRRGEDADARVLWINIPTEGNSAKKNSLPYDPDEMDTARTILSDPEIRNVSLESLDQVNYTSPLRTVPVIREKDILELWDTTPDLLGNEMDVSRYIRDSEDTDIQFFWREWEGAETGSPEEELFAGPHSEELCAVRIDQARSFLKKIREKQGYKAFRFDPINSKQSWEAVRGDQIWPGMTLLLSKASGGYSKTLGWTGDQKDKDFDVRQNDVGEASETNAADPSSKQIQQFVTLPEHSNQVLEAIRAAKRHWGAIIAEPLWDILEQAARWHDVGKSHEQFRRLCALGPDEPGIFYAKFKNGTPARQDPSNDQQEKTLSPRLGFRHELAGAIAYLLNHQEPVEGEERAFHNLVAYLIASHHGKVRASIRSLPNEEPPKDQSDRRVARGVCDGDELPETKLGGDVVMPKTILDLRYMELGASDLGPSWLTRVLELRRRWGPFRLSMLEAIFRTADWKASKEEVSDHE